MEKMKKHFLRRLALVMALLTLTSVLLVGCGEKPEPDPDPKDDEVIVQPEPVETPVDVAAAQKKWVDLIGYIQVPNAAQCAISEGHWLAQSPKSTQSSTGYDDDYYLNHTLDGVINKAGELYIQAYYNKGDLSDPMTVIYGHNMANRSQFGGLQSYGETMKFSDEDVVNIYQAGRQLTYRIFAGVPYDTSHVLYYHDFSDEKVFNDFFQALVKAADDPKYKSSNELNAFYSAEGCVNVDKDNLPVAGDKVIILATCKNGDDNHRYWIMAKLVEDSAEPVVMTKEEAEQAGVTPDRIIGTAPEKSGTDDTASKTN